MHIYDDASGGGFVSNGAVHMCLVSQLGCEARDVPRRLFDPSVESGGILVHMAVPTTSRLDSIPSGRGRGMPDPAACSGLSKVVASHYLFILLLFKPPPPFSFRRSIKSYHVQSDL